MEKTKRAVQPGCKRRLLFQRMALAFHFGLLAAWGAFDGLAGRLAGGALAGSGVWARLGALAALGVVFSAGFYAVLLALERVFPFIQGKAADLARRQPWAAAIKFGKRAGAVLQRRWIRAGLMAMLILAACMAIFGGNLRAQWWVIDDHELMLYLGADGELSPGEILRALMTQTEVAHFGGKPRYRPSYYALRLVETALWGSRPDLFYMARILILAFFAAAGGLIAAGALGWAGGLLAGTAGLGFAMWGDIISRLGPSEAYAALGLALFALGAQRYCTDTQRQRGWGLIFAGAVIAMGAKENMLFLMVPLAGMLAWAVFQKRLRFTQGALGSLALAYGGMIALAVLMGIRAWGGRDLYAGAVSGGSVGGILLHEMETFPLSMVKYFPQPLLTVVLAYGAAVAGLGLAMGLDGSLSKETRRQVWAVWIWCGGWLLGVTALFLTQRIFYAAGWPTGMRYDFPGMLGGLVLLCVLMGAGVRLLDLQGGSRAVRTVFRLGVLAVLAGMIVKNSCYAELRAGARENAARTQAFTRHIETLRDMAADCPAVPIVMESFSIYDSEPVLSISYFLRAYGVENPLMVRLHGVRADDYPTGSGDRSLAGMLESASQRGGWGNTVPLANADTLEKGCLSLFLSGAAETECENAGRIW